MDLGAAPGGWLQVAAGLVGREGKVVGVDLERIEPPKEKNVFLVQDDITSEAVEKPIIGILGSPADCILSDLSPRLSGIRDADLSRSIELCRSAFRLACRLLRPGGNFLLKTFVGEELKSFSEELSTRFRSVERTRPQASRKGSSEIYLCAKGFQNGQMPGHGGEDSPGQSEDQQL